MKKWERIEQSALDYLKNNYKEINFISEGGHDSSVSDIFVKTDKKSFYIEVKSPESACGQFVLIDTGENFIFSNRNKTKENEYVNTLIKVINNEYHHFSEEVTTNGDIVTDDEEVAFNWVKDYYKSKNVLYFIVPNNSSSYLLVPINRLEQYFTIKTTFRIKKSGSSNPSKKNIPQITDLKYVNSYQMQGGKMFVTIEDKPNIFNESLDGTNFLFKYDNKLSQYRVTKLSKTRNKNILFYITLKRQDQIASDIEEFKKDLYG